MTERFKITNFLITENGFALTNEQATDRLNELYNENEQLQCKIELLENTIDMLKGKKELEE